MIRVTVPLAALAATVVSAAILRPSILTNSEYEGFFCRAFVVMAVVSILANANRSRRTLLGTAITLSVLWLLTCAWGAFLVQWHRAFNGPSAITPSQVVPKWILFGLATAWLCAAAKHAWLLPRIGPNYAAPQPPAPASPLSRETHNPMTTPANRK
jgi:hypothetical protein